MKPSLFLILSLLAVACSSASESKLEKTLSVAVKERKITQEKRQNIILEYNKLLEEDQPVARQYFDQIIIAIEMGGDSSHIDAVRKHILRKKKPKRDIHV